MNLVKTSLALLLLSSISFATDPSYSVFQMHMGNGHCTAFAISSVRFATAAHCLEDESGVPGLMADSFILVDRNGRRIVVKRQWVDEKNDIGTLIAGGPVFGLIPLELATEEPKYGDRIFVIGNVFNAGWVKEDGIVKSVQTNEILTNLAGNPGFSGAPVFNSHNKVVGVLVAGIMNGPVRNYTVIKKIKWLRGR